MKLTKSIVDKVASMAILYRHIRLDKNEVFYVGIGENKKRAYNKRSRSIYWKRVASTSEYEIEFVFEDLTWKEACEKEKEFIALYGRKDLGTGTLVNLTDGGEGVPNMVRSKEWKLERSRAMKGNKIGLGKTHSQESKKLMSKAKMGDNNPSKRRDVIEKAKTTRKKNPFKHTEETLQKMKGPRGHQKQLTCPHCNKTGGATGIKQWHFENCKYL